MKFAFSTNAYRNFSLEDSITSIATCGYTGVEIMCDTPHAYPPLSDEKIKSIKSTLKSHNMKISNLNAFMMTAIHDFHHPSWIEKSFESRQLRIQHTINCIELASKLGSHSISTEPGGPFEKSDEKRALDTFEDGINQVLPIAEKNQIKLLIEPEPGLLLENSSQFLKFIERFDSKFLGLNFDIGHFYCVKENPADLIKSLQDWIYHVHLEDISKDKIHEHLIPGHGSIDFKRIFNSLHEINYQGFVTVELYPYLQKPESAAKEALSCMSALI